MGWGNPKPPAPTVTCSSPASCSAPPKLSVDPAPAGAAGDAAVAPVARAVAGDRARGVVERPVRDQSGRQAVGRDRRDAERCRRAAARSRRQQGDRDDRVNARAHCELHIPPSSVSAASSEGRPARATSVVEELHDRERLGDQRVQLDTQLHAPRAQRHAHADADVGRRRDPPGVAPDVRRRFVPLGRHAQEADADRDDRFQPAPAAEPDQPLEQADRLRHVGVAAPALSTRAWVPRPANVTRAHRRLPNAR